MNAIRKKARELIDRDDYWMGMAFFVASGSKNYGRQQGAVIISSSTEEIISMACDGTPKAMQDCNHFVQAEMNAIFSSKIPIQHGILYSTHTPDYHCCLAILSVGIKRVVYYKTKELEENSLDALRTGYVTVEKFHGNLNWMRDYMKTLESLNIFN